MTLDNPGKLNATDARCTPNSPGCSASSTTTTASRRWSSPAPVTRSRRAAHLDWIAEQVHNYELVMSVWREAGDIVRTMIDCDTPIVSAINGVAVGAGLAVGLMADVSVINESARLTDGHIRLGVAAGDHAVAIWPLLCGLAKAKYYLMTADFLDGREAERIGLVSRAVPADEVLPTAMSIAERLARGPRDATRLTKRALNHWLRQSLPNFEASLAYEMLNFMGPDPVEGLAALRESRPPEFGK